jgi:DNA-binding GntR family transcriptional regulator
LTLQPIRLPSEAGPMRNTAYDRMLDAIIFGELQPGSSVDEKFLAEHFELGVAAVRDALLRLSLEGIVERQPRIGTRITDLGLREMQDVFEARVLIEGGCASLAAERATPENITAMRAALDGFEAVIEQRDFRTLVHMDQHFHRALAAATQNRQIEQKVVQLHDAACRFWYFGLHRMEPRTVLADIAAHLDVVAAIERRDAAAAATAMRAVLGHFPETVRNFFSTSSIPIG